MDDLGEVDTTSTCDLCIVEPSAANIWLVNAEGDRYHQRICAGCRRFGWITQAAGEAFQLICIVLVALLVFKVAVAPMLVTLLLLGVGGYCNELRTLHYDAPDRRWTQNCYMFVASFTAGSLCYDVSASVGIFMGACTFLAFLSFKFNVSQTRRRLRYIAPRY